MAFAPLLLWFCGLRSTAMSLAMNVLVPIVVQWDAASFVEVFQCDLTVGQITSGFRKLCQAQNQKESKIFRFSRKENQGMIPPVSPDKRGARDRLERAVGCGGRESCD
jgi:hypothetical protein